MSSDNTMAKIKPLSNSNYPEWCGEMKAWLMRNGLWRLVSKKERKPAASLADELEKWEIKAAGEIYLLVENDQRVHFMLELDYVICHMVSRLTNLVMSWSQG